MNAEEPLNAGLFLAKMEEIIRESKSLHLWGDSLDNRPPSLPAFPILAKPSRNELACLARLSGLSVAALKLAVRRGFLSVTEERREKSWALADSSRWLCRLFGSDDARLERAWTTKGSWESWPLGCIEAVAFPSIALVEGGCDFLAAWHFIEKEGCAAHCAPVGMLAPGHRLPTAALDYFRGKRVRIFAHIDQPNSKGERASLETAARRTIQLKDAGAYPHTFDLSGLKQTNGEAVENLNDLARISAEDLASDPELSVVITF